MGPEVSGVARYRRLLPVLGVVLLIVMAVIVLTVREGRPETLEPSNQPPPAGRPWPTGSWELTHQIELPSGWTTGRQEIRVNGSSTEIGGSWTALVPDADPDDFVSCGVTVLRPGQSMPRPAKTEPVTVGDVSAEYAPAARGGQPAGVFWRGPAGGWANVSCFRSDDRDYRTEALWPSGFASPRPPSSCPYASRPSPGATRPTISTIEKRSRASSS